MQKVGIIGAGKVGTSLGLHLFRKGNLELTVFYSKTLEHAQYSAKLTESQGYERLADLVANNYVLIITTPDDCIKNVWRQSKATWFQLMMKSFNWKEKFTEISANI